MPITLHDCSFSIYPSGTAINGRWGCLHIASLVVGFIALIPL